MATPQLERISGPLVGRERECAAIDRLLEAAAGGQSSSLVLRGEAGIGKTALLTYAAEGGGGGRVLRTTGVEAESDLAFAGLYGLLRPIVESWGSYRRRRRARWRAHSGSVPRLARTACWSRRRR
jgi:AAA ATPase domain